MTIEIVVPQVGEAVAEVTLVKWLKNEGDQVQKGEPLFEVDTDKAVVEVEAFADGKLVQILVPAGSVVMPRQVVGLLAPAGEAVVSPKAAAHLDEAPRLAQAAPYDNVSPVARRIAAELGVDLKDIEGTGPGGRIVAKDVRQLAAHGSGRAAVPAGSARVRASPKARRLAEELGVDLAGLVGTGVRGLITTKDVVAAAQSIQAASSTPAGMQPLSKLRQAIANRMTLSKTTIPHFYVMRDVDMTQATRLREQASAQNGEKPSYTAILLRACALALCDFPALNANLRDGCLFPRQTIDIGVAVSVEPADGEEEASLIVPMIRDVDKKTLQKVSQELSAVVERARSNRLRPDDLEANGRSLIISNLGMYKVDAFIPIIDPSDPMILAMGAVADRPWVEDGELVVRLAATLTLAADHRIMDGAAGARFLDRICEMIEHPNSL